VAGVEARPNKKSVRRAGDKSRNFDGGVGPSEVMRKEEEKKVIKVLVG
jgi:hypothetical protein